MGDFKNKEKSRDASRDANRGMFSTAKAKAAKVLSEPVTEPTKEETITAIEALETVTEPETPVNPHPITPAPKKKGRPLVNRETKKRYTFTLLPSIYDMASELASQRGKSLSEVVGDFLAEYIK